MTMKTTLKLPIGVEFFEDICRNDYYHVDETGLIGDLLKDGGKVTLFTRPRREIEQLVNGECITKKIVQELTYRQLFEKIDNVWSVLFTTGYLTQRGKTEEDAYLLAIPNLEIRQIFLEQIEKMGYEERLRQDGAESIVR